MTSTDSMKVISRSTAYRNRKLMRSAVVSVGDSFTMTVNFIGGSDPMPDGDILNLVKSWISRNPLEVKS